MTGATAPPPEGVILRIEVDGVPVAVTRVDGRLLAVDDTCTHMQCSLAGGDVEGRTIVCPCHLGVFDLGTGAVLDGPPTSPLRTWQVAEADGVLQVRP